MSLTANKAFVCQAIEEVFRRRDENVLDAYFAVDAVPHRM